MDIQEIKQLIKIVEKSDIDELELEEEGRKIRISKNSKSAAGASPINGMPNPVFYQPQMPPPAAIASEASAPSTPAAPAAPDVDKYLEVRSPMVGTFYRSPAPDADPYVEVGDTVSAGDTVCIIEAMKLMNEIETEVTGRIAKIMVENAQPVEFNQVLFLIEK
ncbi:MAG: acetyl-CoA carboxylase biotin carboxyl carrier protein [Calditrichaeota bacterium]|nr:acetyl-CoA carboxylase biotin carboxyl carrier protein [Calditrichota bacterium]MCB0302876.1 acetyl-CoA carboxylase biotin carboxyl carrier protein [Calditrichota bacterium]MCB9088010.1 acetyl-CoA carboxylase biotin carboxyl carrier protein [Calditrichia bacterium]